MLVAASAGAWAQPDTGKAGEDHQLCNRTGYILEAVLAIETQGASATQGWFRLLPGSCAALLDGASAGERYFLHVRTPAFYGEKSEHGEVSRMFCVKEGDFLLAGASRCGKEGGALAAFSEVGGGTRRVSELTEPRNMDAATARIAAIQRLLAIAGYPAGDAEGRAGKKTAEALDAFAAAQGRPSLAGKAVLDAAPGDGGDEALFAALYDAAAKAARGTGLTLCNATAHAVMAAVATQKQNTVTSRGWYAVAPGNCEKVIARALGKEPVWLHAEAVDARGEMVVSDGRPLIWGGEKALCTSASEFEIAEQGKCADRGLRTAGFFLVNTTSESGMTLRLSPENRSGDEKSR
jgi:uncharacterized membrane protein